jgi:hypothetical protein
MKRHATELESQASVPVPPAQLPPAVERKSTVTSRATDVARYSQELEDRYVAAREAWTEAMHTANSGRPADMASLAIAQQAYETVAAEREHWLASGRVAIPIQPSTKRSDVEIAVGQELAWRRVHEHQSRSGLLSRIRRRLSGH